MRAIALDFNSRTPTEISLPPPGAPGPGEVLFRVEACGVCATDRELARFHFGAPPAAETTLVLGHEALGEVVAAGRGKRLDDGTVVSLDVKVGDRILFGKYGGNDIKIDGEEYLILREDEVLGVLEPVAAKK